ncbi:MAG: hypothetical protein NC182_03600 [Prevotella sp.]|nr:hypothetical protein [Staphylococcus sp.]MCM1350263.1 hypothetical protein [Prevotella sp.]
MQLHLKRLTLICMNMALVLITGCKTEIGLDHPQVLPPVMINKNIFSDYTNEALLKHIIQSLTEKGNYYIETSGETIARKGLISYKQATATQLYAMPEGFYSTMVTDSLFVKHEHRLYYDNQLVQYYDSDEKKVITTSAKDYLDEYGKLPSHDTLFTYLIQDNTILNATRVIEGDICSITYQLDPVLSTIHLAKQMRRFGKLSQDPIFQSVTLTIQIDKQLRLKCFDSVEEYQIEKDLLGKMMCTQHLSSQIYYDGYEIPR